MGCGSQQIPRQSSQSRLSLGCLDGSLSSQHDRAEQDVQRHALPSTRDVSHLSSPRHRDPHASDQVLRLWNQGINRQPGIQSLARKDPSPHAEHQEDFQPPTFASWSVDLWVFSCTSSGGLLLVSGSHSEVATPASGPRFGYSFLFPYPWQLQGSSMGE